MAELNILLENEEKRYDAAQYGLNMDSSSDDILNAVQSIILEETGVNIKDEDGNFIYGVTKSTDKETIFVDPKTVAG